MKAVNLVWEKNLQKKSIRLSIEFDNTLMRGPDYQKIPEGV